MGGFPQDLPMTLHGTGQPILLVAWGKMFRWITPWRKKIVASKVNVNDC